MARHTYDDWLRDSDTNAVGLILADLPNRRVRVKWHDGRITEGMFHYDLISEYEYYKIVDPKRCGADVHELAAAMYAGAQRDYFTGGIFPNSMVKSTQREDYFS